MGKNTNKAPKLPQLHVGAKLLHSAYIQGTCNIKENEGNGNRGRMTAANGNVIPHH